MASLTPTSLRPALAGRGVDDDLSRGLPPRLRVIGRQLDGGRTIGKTTAQTRLDWLSAQKPRRAESRGKLAATRAIDGLFGGGTGAALSAAKAHHSGSIMAMVQRRTNGNMCCWAARRRKRDGQSGWRRHEQQCRRLKHGDGATTDTCTRMWTAPRQESKQQR